VDQANKIIEVNQGINMTTIVNQALKMWLENPVMKVAKPRSVSIEEIEQQMEDEADLLVDLAK